MQDDRLVRVLKALADTKRFRMVREIAAAGELTCGQVGEMFDLSQPTISHHLKLLADAGVLVVRQDGQNHYISVDQDLLARVVGSLPGRLNAPAPRPAPARVRRA
jgi:ArsR family transcriptional regulator